MLDLNFSLITYLPSLPEITENCVIGIDAVYKWVSEPKRSDLSQLEFCVHNLAVERIEKMRGVQQSAESIFTVRGAGCHLWLLNQPQHPHESGFDLTCMDVFLYPPGRVTKRYCANSRSCSLTDHSIILTQQ